GRGGRVRPGRFAGAGKRGPRAVQPRQPRRPPETARSPFREFSALESGRLPKAVMTAKTPFSPPPEKSPLKKSHYLIAPALPWGQVLSNQVRRRPVELPMKSVEATSSHRQIGIRPIIASASFAHRLDRALSAAARVLRGERPHPNLRLPLAFDSLEVRALLSTITVHIFNNDFSINPKGQPIADAIINVGDTIHWVWDDPDPSPHNTQSVTGSLESWNSGAPTFPPASFDHTFNNA